MRWPRSSVCQSLDLEKETFRCDSCFPSKVYFLCIKDKWFAFRKYVQINLALTSSLHGPPQLLSFFQVKTIHWSNFQPTTLVKRKKGRIPAFTKIKNAKNFKNRLKAKDLHLPKLVGCRTTWFYLVRSHRRHHDDEIYCPRFRSAL